MKDTHHPSTMDVTGAIVAWLLVAVGVALSAVSLLSAWGWPMWAGVWMAVGGAVMGKVATGRIWPFLLGVLAALVPVLLFVILLLTWSDT